MNDPAQTQAVNSRYWDPLIHQLQEFRRTVGSPSYATIAQQVASQREADGTDPYAARVAKSTIFDAFQTGRPRVNVEFVREIAQALGATEVQVDGWVRECRHAEAPVLDNPVASRADIAMLMVGCIAFNMVGRVVVDVLHLPIYLDMWGTAIAALALGPWRGAAVGGATNVLAALTSGWVSIPFAVVNMAGGLAWGYGIHRYGMGKTLARFFGLNLLVAIACSLLAVPILVLVFGGSVGQGQDTLTQTFIQLGNGLATAVGFSNIMTSTADKVISGFVALVIITGLPWRIRSRVPLVLADTRPQG